MSVCSSEWNRWTPTGRILWNLRWCVFTNICRPNESLVKIGQKQTHCVFLRVVGAEAEETVFITTTKCILRDLRFEAEEILEHQTSSIVDVKRRDRGFKIR